MRGTRVAIAIANSWGISGGVSERVAQLTAVPVVLAAVAALCLRLRRRCLLLGLGGGSDAFFGLRHHEVRKVTLHSGHDAKCEDLYRRVQTIDWWAGSAQVTRR